MPFCSLDDNHYVFLPVHLGCFLTTQDYLFFSHLRYCRAHTAADSIPSLSPTNVYVHMYVDQKGSAAMLAAKRSAGDGEFEESVVHRKHASKGIHPIFETQGRCHQKSETAVSLAPQKGLTDLTSAVADPAPGPANDRCCTLRLVRCQ